MKRNLLFIFCIILSVLILFPACLKDVGKPATESSPAQALTTTGVDDCKTNVKFSKDIQPILNTYCNINSGCHGDTPPSATRNFTSYARFSPFSSQALQFVKTGYMPMETTTGPKTLSACEITKLQTWVDQGSPNN